MNYHFRDNCNFLLHLRLRVVTCKFRIQFVNGVFDENVDAIFRGLEGNNRFIESLCPALRPPVGVSSCWRTIDGRRRFLASSRGR